MPVCMQLHNHTSKCYLHTRMLAYVHITKNAQVCDNLGYDKTKTMYVLRMYNMQIPFTKL